MARPHSPLVHAARLAALAILSLLLAGCAALDTAGALLTNQLTFSEAQLQAYLDRQPPMRHEAMGGLLTLSVVNPKLAIPDDGTRLHLDFDVGVAGLGMRGDTPAGHIAITSGLRYDTRTDALYLEEPELESADLPLVGGRMNTTGRDLINGWLRDYARDEPIYTLDPELAGQLGQRRVAGTLIQNGRVVVKLDR